jgi:hypothetical protein
MNKFEVVAYDDPEACALGGCKYKRHPDSTYCPRHMGRGAGDSADQELKNYYLTKFKARVESKVYSTRLKSLIEEIGILRLVLETIINNATDEFDLILYYGKITEVVNAIRQTVESCVKLEEKSSLVLDQAQIVVVARKLIDIISEQVPEDKVEMVATRVLEAFTPEHQ